MVLRGPGPGGRLFIYFSHPGILSWGVGASWDTLGRTLAKGSEGRSWEPRGAIALIGSQESRQQPHLPPPDVTVTLGKSLPFSVALGSKRTRWSVGCVLFPYSAACMHVCMCVCARVRICTCVRACGCPLSPPLGLASTLVCSVFSYVLPLRTIFLGCVSPQGRGLTASSLVSPMCGLLCTGLDTGWNGCPPSTHS